MWLCHVAYEWIIMLFSKTLIQLWLNFSTCAGAMLWSAPAALHPLHRTSSLKRTYPTLYSCTKCANAETWVRVWLFLWKSGNIWPMKQFWLVSGNVEQFGRETFKTGLSEVVENMLNELLMSMESVGCVGSAMEQMVQFGVFPAVTCLTLIPPSVSRT